MSEARSFLPLTIQLFGTFTAKHAAVPLTGLHLREGERMLAYLTLRAGTPVSSRELAQRFWPAEAQGSLDGQGDFPSVRQALRSLRQALDTDAERLTRPNRSTVLLDLTGVEVDVLLFDHNIHTGRDADAVMLYTGPLLAGWTETWAVEARTQRRHQYENALRRLAPGANREGQLDDAARWLRLLHASRPTDEEAGRNLLRLLTADHRHAEAREVLEHLTQAVAAVGRGLEPDTAELIEELRRTRENPVSSAHSFSSTTDGIGSISETASAALESPQTVLESPHGAVSIRSTFYIAREADASFYAALTRRDSTVLLKGARQAGKTSLLARGLQQAREAGMRVVTTDFKKFNATQFASPDALYQALAANIAHQLGLSMSPRAVWDEDLGSNMNMEMFLRSHVLPAFSEPLVWGMDEVDRLFTCPFSDEVFGLFRSWHNERSLEPTSVLCRLTLAIAYATEAHLFITDLNQSPFNIGTRLALTDFTPEQVAQMNRLHGFPWSRGDLVRFTALVGGHPYLVRLGLDQAAQGVQVDWIEADAGNDDGLFGDHLRRLMFALRRSPEQADALQAFLAGSARLSPEAFFRLRAAGILSGHSSQDAVFRCSLYQSYFARQLGSA